MAHVLTLAEGPVHRPTLDGLRAMQRPGRPDVVARVIGVYLESAPKLLDTLRRATIWENPEALREAAHSFRSCSATVGALGLATLLGKLEILGGAGSTEGAGELLAEIEAEFDPVRAALASELS